MARNLFRHDPVIGYRFVPNLKGRVRHEGGGYLVRSNAQGFRSDRPFVTEPNPDTSRILFFGDSNTAGDGVSNGKRFSDVVERVLEGVETYNYGLPSSGVDQQYLAWRENGRHVAHDLLVLCPMVDNIRRNLQSARMIHSSMSGDLVMLPKPYYELEGGALQLRNSPVPKGHLPVQDETTEQESPSGLRLVARRAMGVADKQFPGLRSWSQRARRMALPEPYNDPNSQGWALMAAILRRWISEAPGPVLLCPIPMFDHISGKFRAEPYRQRFRELAAETGVEFVDILDGLRAATNGEHALRFPTDEHPTVAGHRVIAAQMIPAIAKHLSTVRPEMSVASTN